MAGTLKKIFIENWQRKVLAIVLAVCLWLIIDHAITTTRTFTNVPIRVVNIPSDKTIRGLLPNGILDKQMTLTLTGTKELIEKIEPGDFEVVVDASHKGDEWIVRVGKKNLVSLNPDIDLMHNVTGISQSAMTLRLSKLLTDKIPIYIRPPRGEPPEGYQYLDIWPQKLMHVVSGPEEEVREQQVRGIELTFDLSQIKADDLDRLESTGATKDEISYPVPDNWKQVIIPFLPGGKQEVNGPEARHLHINFLRKKLHAMPDNIPIGVFYSLRVGKKMNPLTYPLETNDLIVNQNGILVVRQALLVEGVSRLFLDIVKEHLEFVIGVFGEEKGEELPVSIQYINSRALEDRYIKLVLGQEVDPLKERFLRERFRQYKRTLQFYKESSEPFVLQAKLEEHSIRVTTK